MTTVRDLGEFGLIRQLQQQLRSRHIGDDCALLPGRTRDRYLLMTCDPVIEGVHYPDNTPPRQIGWKAMARNLSDIAAMSGLPRWATVSLGLRPDTPARHVRDLYAGMTAVASQFGCTIVGGDTAHLPYGPQFIVVTLIGEVERKRVTLRSGARPGDRVFVTGKLGGSFQSGKHLTFTPRIREARALTARYDVHAMMDISDGLASDLYRLVDSSRVGFEIASDRIPANGSVPAALSDGEDFELLFTVPPGDAARLRRKYFEIGHVIRQPVVRLDGQPLQAKGYDHFAQSR